MPLVNVRVPFGRMGSSMMAQSTEDKINRIGNAVGNANDARQPQKSFTRGWRSTFATAKLLTTAVERPSRTPLRSECHLQSMLEITPLSLAINVVE